MGICLNMIVKNEARTLPRLFASLAGQVDFYVISDTGSTDNTIEMLRQLGDQYGIPGEVHQHGWINFAHNRNRALEAAFEAKHAGRHHCGWLMFMDADEEFEVYDSNWKKDLAEGRSYSTYKQTGDWAMKYPFLVWMEGNQWTWKGEIHNYLVQAPGSGGYPFLNTVAIRYHSFEGAKSHAFNSPADKAKADIDMLESELRDCEVDQSNAFRFFQLAFACRNANDVRRAIDVMRRVADCPGISEDRRYTAMIFTAGLLIQEDLEQELSGDYLQRAIAISPFRKEAYFYLSGWYRQSKQMSLAVENMFKAYELNTPESGALFLERNIYTWKAAYQLAFLSYRQGNLQLTSKLVDELLDAQYLPDAERGFVLQLKHRLELEMTQAG